MTTAREIAARYPGYHYGSGKELEAQIEAYAEEKCQAAREENTELRALVEEGVNLFPLNPSPEWYSWARKGTAALNHPAAVNQRTHSLERTSPFGEAFTGYCTLCGQTGLTTADALKPCPNPRGVSSDQAVLDAIDGPAAVPAIEGGGEKG